MSQFHRVFQGSRKSVLAWILYDVASSGYVLLIPSVAFAVYYRQVVCGGTSQCDGYWAGFNSLALIISGVLSPILGAIADLGTLRHRLFVTTTLLCCGATAVLYWVQPRDLWFGGLAFVIAHVGYILSAGLYDAFLPVLVPPSQVERLSSLGWGLGYVGGLVCFFMSYGWLKGGLEPANLATYRLTFLLVAGFYFAIALPAIAWLPRETADSKDRRPGRLIARAYQKVLHTVFHWRDLSAAFRFLVGYYLISDGVVTVGSFIAIYLTTVFGMNTAQILQLTLLFNVIAIPATMGVGLLSHRWKAQTLLAGIIAIWVGLLLLMALGTQPWIPFVIIVLLGLVIGSTQSICRGLYAQIIPVNQASELFGFHSLVSKVSAVFGPLTYGLISASTGNQRLAIVSLIIFFLAGGRILSTVAVSEETTD